MPNDIPQRSLLAVLLLLVSGLFVLVPLTINAKQESDFSSNQITQKIETRFSVHARILISAAAHFAASDNITRQEWQTFRQHLALESQFSGMHGLG
ncbi:MAG: hypothetical protein NTW32_18970 [Chloroflexi bacterium]|nr:hypothetical protein [Chloroflexota bacterium]